ncbi:MAG: glycosyltransferase [Gammaproteobacteria bacterium]|jgi:glycosyltransferase involved in cell wall biosynthesis|nr:glycosyltransferase [Gammaproteobacteria bacterium]
MQLSFVIPAFNEAACIEACLGAIAEAVAACQPGGADEHGVAFAAEVIVVDNNSTDATAELAAAAGATVVFEPVNQIARARNAGAAAASGDWLVFIDADSLLSAGLLADVLRLIAAGQHVGCGSLMTMDDMPPSARWMLSTWSWLSARLNWAAGSFIVCRADAFAALGGFDEALYAAEEIDFSQRIKRYARKHGSRFTVLRDHPLHTSNRKVKLYSTREQYAQLWRLMLRPRKALRDKAALGVWYDGRR